MTIKRLLFDVEYLDDPDGQPREFRTRVVMRDRLDVEQHGHKCGLVEPKEQPQLMGLLWLWYSARREGHVPAETTFDEFAVRCLDNAAVGQGEEVPPTTEEESEPSSSSPTTSPASTGSPPATNV